MSRRPPQSWEHQDRRNSRIRELREQREGPVRRRRRVQPLLFIGWVAGVIALVAALLVLGFVTIFAPRVMAWVEENPGAIEHGIVQDFVNWYSPGELSDDPAGADRERITFEVPEGATDSQIGALLQEQGLIRSQIAFQYQIIQAGREGTLAAGVYDLSPTLRPSQILAAMQGIPMEDTEVQIGEALRLEEVVAAVGQSALTVNLEELAAFLQNPPPEFLNQYDFLAELRDTRSLEGYLAPDTYRIEISATPEEIAKILLDEFAGGLTEEIRAGIAAKGLSIDEAVIIASIVEREAVLDEERPLIAAVYINRFLNASNGETNGLLNADPTLQYGLTTAENRPIGNPLIDGTEGGTLPVDQWPSVDWWPQLQVGGGEVALPEFLASYQTYLNPGLPAGPIAAPRIASIEAVATAPIDNGFLYFVAGCPDGVRDGSHYFAATNAEHEANTARAAAECAGQ
jgi:UPF0755 protein